MEWYVFVIVVLILSGILFNYRKTLGGIQHSYKNHFFNNSRPMWVFEPKTLQIADVNNAAISCYGYSKEEFLHMTLRDIIPASEIERLEHTLQGSSHDTTNKNIGIHKKKNGDTLYANVISRGISWKGELLRVAIINNVTELVTSKEKLQEVNNQLAEMLQRYDTVTEATHDAVWEYDLEMNTVLWNRGIETIFGYSDVSTAADVWFSKIHPEEMEVVKASLAAALRNKQKTWTIAYRFCCADGNYKHIENRVVIVYTTEGKAVKIIGSMRDVEDKYQLEKEVVKLSMIAQLSSNAILVMDKDGFIEWANESFTNMTGFTLEEVKGKRPPDILHGEETSKLTAREMRELTNAKAKFAKEIINYRKDGSKYWVNVHFTPILVNGELQNTIAIQNDITELKEREQKITEQNQRLKEVAFANSHIIRVPVANIIGLSNLLAMSSTLQEEEKELVTYLLETAGKLDLLIKNIAHRSEMM